MLTLTQKLKGYPFKVHNTGNITQNHLAGVMYI